MTHQLGNSSLPVIDLTPLDSAGGEAAVAAAINAACTGPGFFYVRNHGVPEATIAAAMAAARRFFLLPQEVKMRTKANLIHRGWHAAGGAVMEGAKKPDLKEFFSIGLDLPADHPTVLAGEKLRGPNNWPAEVPELAPAMEAYFDAIGACGAKLLRAVALSLGLDRDFFAPHYKTPLQRTQAIFYPPQAPDDTDGFGVAPHTDFGCITLLWQDDSGGLEVRERQTGAWIPAPPLPGTLVVNVGDLLGRWSNDRFASTPHRVVNRSGHERMSIATFYDPDFSAPVDPRALGATDPHYPPTTCGEHILGRFAQAFAYRKQA
ncbi:isopenicillin N synthase family dioxygenase [Falsiroseomonas ponticola]|uniref:isopenicillin N synthase family dioxygenase n=1 Tax=Falsiroseomonas ponticola TaxID=2786951 RepID=UPI001932D0ED|nr:isopenicillin N synthase family oxygenase [Roseomonas ponticola]